MKRQRGRGRKPGGGGGGGGGNQGNRPHESNGPEVKIRGTAAQIYDKYMQYARDAHSSGDRVKYESYLQHAEHYYRIMAATMPRDRLHTLPDGNGHTHGEEREVEYAPADSLKVVDDGGDDEGPETVEAEAPQRDREDESEEMDASGEDRSGDQARGRGRRRGRRRPRNEGGPGEPAAPGGGDTEARSALDALAQRQAAVAGG